MPKWPVEQFNTYLEAAMQAAGIRDRQHLSKLTGLNNTQFSYWKRGISQPTRDSLEKLAPVLDVPVNALLVEAGRANVADYEVAPDTSLIPKQFRELLAVYEQAPESERRTLLSTLEVLTAGVRSRLAAAEPQPTRRAARPARSA
jgi:transcriptional regulator with XRE-family HTH domain